MRSAEETNQAGQAGKVTVERTGTGHLFFSGTQVVLPSEVEKRLGYKLGLSSFIDPSTIVTDAVRQVVVEQSATKKTS